jgi:hypothetical protein
MHRLINATLQISDVFCRGSGRALYRPRSTRYVPYRMDRTDSIFILNRTDTVPELCHQSVRYTPTYVPATVLRSIWYASTYNLA